MSPAPMPDDELLLSIDVGGREEEVALSRGTSAFQAAQRVAERHGLGAREAALLEGYIDQLRYAHFVRAGSPFNAPVRPAEARPERFARRDPALRAQAAYVERLNASQPAGLSLAGAAPLDASGLLELERVGPDRYRLRAPARGYRAQQAACARLARRRGDAAPESQRPPPRLVRSMLVPNDSLELSGGPE